MKAIRLGLLSALILCQGPQARADVDLPAAAREVLKQYEDESADVDKKIEAEVKKVRDKTCVELKKLQDLFCKEAKLDEAVAIRDLIRCLQADRDSTLSGDLPAAAREVYKQHEVEVADAHKKVEADLVKGRDRTLAELKKIQDAFCKEAKLDEAVAVRDVIRMVRDGVTNALPDPGYVNNGTADIGKVFYYEVTGVTSQSIYGTDVYTTGSHCGMAAVHRGILKDGQKGVVKVTILPGQKEYPATTRHGVASIYWGAYGVSFKVERVYGFVGKPAAVKVELDRGDK
jgi:hypothetical protein